MHQNYPKALYHSTKGVALAQDEAAHKALGAGWGESPVDAKLPTAKETEAIAKEDAPTIAALVDDMAKAEDTKHQKKAK